MTTAFARAIEGIPVVGSTTERDLLFPTPATDSRVQLRTTGEIQRYTGAAWVVDYSSSSDVSGSIAAAIASAQAYTDGATPAGGRTIATLAALLANNIQYNVRDFGAIGDVIQVADGAITTGLAVFTSATAAFTPAAVGKRIVILGAGAAGAPLSTTILTYTNATTVSLAANAGTTVAGATAAYGTDSGPAIMACFAAALAAGRGTRTMLIPGGNYFSSIPLPFSVTGFSPPKGIRIVGDHLTTWIFPLPSVTTVAMTIAGDSNADGITNGIILEGVNGDGIFTTGAVIGLLVGENAGHLTSYPRVRSCEWLRFAGVGAIGISVKDVVGATFDDVNASRNYVNWQVGGSDPALPTTCRWYGGAAREALTKGLKLVQGYQLIFRDFVRESNGEEGTYTVPTAGQNVTEVLFQGGWDENNWTTLAGTPATRVTKAQNYADATLAGTVSISLDDVKWSGIARAVDWKGVKNVRIRKPTPAVVRISGTTISATATGYNRSVGSWVDDGFFVGQQLRVRGFATAGNNGQGKIVTAVTAADISVAGTSVEAAGPSVTVVVQSIFLDATCIGVIEDFPVNNVPLDVVQVLAPFLVSGSAFWQGRLIIDPDTGHLLPASSGALSLGTSVFRFLDAWLAGKLTALNAEITSVLTMTGAIVGNSGGNKDVLLQSGTAAGRVVMRDSGSAERVRMLGTGDFQALVSSLIGGGGTAITQTKLYSPTLTPAAVAAQSVVEQTFTVSGLTTADKVICVNPPATANNIGVLECRVSAADTLAVRFVNPTAGALTPTSGTYLVLTMRS